MENIIQQSPCEYQAKENVMSSGLTEIYLRHVDRVYRLCLMLLGSREEAEDVTQWVFMQMLKSGPVFTDAEHEKAWLIVVAKNRCRNLLKGWWRKNRSDMENVPEQSCAFTSSLDGIEASLSQLPEKYRMILYLRYCESCSCEMIAQMLRMNPSTVGTRCNRGLKMLKSILESEEDER